MKLQEKMKTTMTKKKLIMRIMHAIWWIMLSARNLHKMKISACVSYACEIYAENNNNITCAAKEH